MFKTSFRESIISKGLSYERREKSYGEHVGASGLEKTTHKQSKSNRVRDREVFSYDCFLGIDSHSVYIPSGSVLLESWTKCDHTLIWENK